MEQTNAVEPISVLEIDNSKRSTFATCPRKYYLRYVKHLTGATGSSALRFGSTWHALMEGYYGSIIEHGWGGADHMDAAYQLAVKVWEKESEGKEFFTDYRTLENCFESFVHYLSEFSIDQSQMEVISSERIFKIRMNLSDVEKSLYPTLRNSTLYFTGKLDLEVKMSGQNWLMEFKSTGQPIQMQADRLQRSAQILGYTWAGKQLGSDQTGVLVSIHQILSRKVKDGGYGKVTRNFLRHPNVFSNGDLESWRESYLYTCEQMCSARETNHFPMEFDSCYQFGRCGFTRICEQNRPFEECNLDGFVLEEWNVLETGASKEDVEVIEI